MNRKQFFTLLVLLVVLGGGGLLLSKKQRSSWAGGTAGTGQKLFADFPLNDVAHIVIREGTNEVSLSRKDDLWRVRERRDYPANFQALREFLLKMPELKATQTEQVGPSQLPRLQLAAGQGTNEPTIVEFKNQDGKILHSLWLGKKLMRKSNQPSPFGDGSDEGFPAGRYVKTAANSPDVAVISEVFENIEPRPEQWLNKDFFHVEKPRSVEVTFPEATNSWKLTRESDGAEWKLADAKPEEKLDDTKLSGVTSPFSGAFFNDVLAEPQGSTTNAPMLVRIETFDDFVYEIKVSEKVGNEYPLNVAVNARIPKERSAGADEKPEDKARLDQEFKTKQQKLEEKLKQEQGYREWTFLVQPGSVESLLKPRSELLAQKVEEAKEADNAADPAGNKAEETKLETSALPEASK